MPIKNVLLFMIAGLCCAACHQPVKDQKSDTPLLSPVPPKPLPDAVFKRYHDYSTHFFDSLLIKRGSFNGSILVARDGNIVYEKYCGYIDPVQKKDSFTAGSAFHLASVSKTFTAMGILKLWQDKKINLEDTLSEYFPHFPYPGITIKMLLNHRSGLPNYTHYLEAYHWNKKKVATNADILNSLYTMHPPLDFPSGRRFAYCNTNYVLLALIIEKVSGESYPGFMKNTFFI
ncbi:MAG TPA: serine hydrolase domain-containing protein, partial [Chitinophagaceae bacterium]|nr:serine hydrolase domain-containing protein [Chitinophagaceae bacterium]